MRCANYLLIIGLLALGGCTSAGEARYTLTTQLDSEGKATSFSIDIHNTKNVGEVLATVTLPDGTSILLSEKGVDASGPMSVMAESNARLLDSVLGVVP